MAKNKRPQLFKFNLLPPKSEVEIAFEQERNDSTVYALVLVFVVILAYFFIFLGQTLFIDTRLAAGEEALLAKQIELDSYNTIKSAHGELFVKTSTLKPVLEKNIDPADIFLVAEQITEVNDNLQVISYNRENTGVFVFEVISADFSEVSEMVEAAEALTAATDVFVRSSTWNETTSTVKTTIALNIEVI